MNNESEALAPARAPQEKRTFFVTAVCSGHRALLQSHRMAGLLMDVLASHRKQGRFQVHEFVIMPDHVHLLVTPAPDVSLEKAIQYIKGGFSFRAKREFGVQHQIWQIGYNETRVKNTEDYFTYRQYIRQNPVKRGLVNSAHEYMYSSASGEFEVDDAPLHFRG